MGLFEAGRISILPMPELFCGFPQDRGPSSYRLLRPGVVGASVFLLFQACLGLEINGEAQVRFRDLASSLLWAAADSGSRGAVDLLPPP